MVRLGLGSDRRIRTEREFRILHEDGKFARGRYLNFWAYQGAEIRFTENQPRIGIVVSRKANPRATKRNLWKRRVREVFRRNQEKIKSGTAILVQVKASAMPAPKKARSDKKVLGAPARKTVPEYLVLEEEFLKLALKTKALR